MATNNPKREQPFWQRLFDRTPSRKPPSEKYNISLWTDESVANQKVFENWEKQATEAIDVEAIQRRKSKRRPFTHVKIKGKPPPGLKEILPDITHLYITDIAKDADLAAWVSQLPRLLTLRLEMQDEADRMYLHNIFPATLLKTLKLKKFKVSVRELESLTAVQCLALEEVEFVPSDNMNSMLTMLTSLTELHLRKLNLKNVPTGVSDLSGLKILDLVDNDFSKSDEKNDNIFNKLSHLEDLDLSNCCLSQVPTSVEKLVHLKVLKLRSNKFLALPGWLNQFDRLEILDLSGNSSLEILNLATLGDDAGMPSLRLLKVDEACSSLYSPEYNVCAAGVETVRSFYADAAKSQTTTTHMTTALVIGEAEAGKTSLMMSLKNQEWFFTPNTLDRATRVLDVVKIEINGEMFHLIDLGGQPVYQPTYPLAFRANFVPIIVVNMHRYQQLLSADGDELNATRVVCFDWIAHLCLGYPELEPVMLVLTHKDKIAPEMFESLKEKFIQCCKTLETKSGLRNRRLFEFGNIYCIGKAEDFSILSEIRESIYQRCHKKSRQIPTSWKVIEECATGHTKPFKRLSELKEELIIHSFSEKQIRTVLNYMHKKGQVLYYKNTEPLSSVIFSKTEEVVKVVLVLFNHLADAQWKHRGDKFNYDQQVTNKLMYDDAVGEYKKTARMRRELLAYLISEETSFKETEAVELAINLLKNFRLVMEDEQDGQMHYRVPYFSKPTLEVDTELRGDDIQFKVEINFVDYNPPKHAYHQISIKLFDSFPSRIKEVGSNGIRITYGTSTIHLIHNRPERQVMFYLTTSVKCVVAGWDHTIQAINELVDGVKENFPGLRISCRSFCLHCLLRRLTDLKTFVEPSWCKLSGMTIHRGDGTAKTMCNGDEDVPAALRSPCNGLGSKEMADLENYVYGLRMSSSSQEDVSKEKPAITVESNEDLISAVTPDERGSGDISLSG